MSNNEVRKYFVKEAYRTNLESMRIHAWNAIYDITDGKCNKVDIMGKMMDISDLQNFILEIEDLDNKARFGKVTGREYGRIKAISDARNMIRYCQCIDAGMSEDHAGYAFID